MVMTKQVGPNGTPLPGDTSTNSWTSWEDMGGHDLRNVTARESSRSSARACRARCRRDRLSPGRSGAEQLDRMGADQRREGVRPGTILRQQGRTDGHCRAALSGGRNRPSGAGRPQWRLGDDLVPARPHSPGGGDGPIAVALSPDGQLGILDYRLFGGRFFSRQTDLSKHATAAMERVGEGQRRELVAASSWPRPRRSSGRAAIARTGRRG